MNYLLIFDTNALYKNYDKCCDFTDFSFSGTFDNFVSRIEELDIYDIVSIAIPQIVWSEMRKQNIIAYYKKVKEFEDYVEKHKLPFHSYKIDTIKKYEEYLDLKIEEYKNLLENKPITFKELNFPSNRCYSSLINRAFDKRPPFEGKDKSSDKGFKDALLWESILEYKKDHNYENIILYTNDKMFNDELKQEYAEVFPNQEIIFISSETEAILNTKLSQIAKEKDDTYPIPELSSEEYEKLKEYLYSEKLVKDIEENSEKIIGKNGYFHLASFKIIEVNDIENLMGEENYSEYGVAVQAEVIISTNSHSSLTDNISLTLLVSCVDNEVFSLDDITIDEEEETND